MSEGFSNQKSILTYSEKSVCLRQETPKIQTVHFIKMKWPLLFSVRKHPQASKRLVRQLLALSDLPRNSTSWLMSVVINKPCLNLYVIFSSGERMPVFWDDLLCRKTRKCSQGDLLRDVETLNNGLSICRVGT